ncbi:uncharacterized protein LOC107261272 isoform X2 [Ricinus communis]|uniref:uncharacterized protein LOC107261272 isoform X2 n=1 Tax=Ricinus communis TaxID=3988 RepID=UPI00201A876D|nr:uncharacterized protein LOC107261272 isoform X2 [Ricinus communis]
MFFEGAERLLGFNERVQWLYVFEVGCLGMKVLSLSYVVVVKKYEKAKSNLDNLLKLGATTIHGVDATKMKLHSDLKMQKFDRIIYNFPHAGFYGKEDSVQLIKRHKKLVLGFFRNASGMLRPFGEIHVTHKTSAPFCHWNIKELAWRNSLALVECVDFKKQDYPGYNNKRGDGTRCDEPFRLGHCSTFKFRFFAAIKMCEVKSHSEFTQKSSESYQELPSQTHYQPTFFHGGHPQTSSSRNMNDITAHRSLPLAFNARSANLFDRHFDHASEIYQRPTISDVDYFANKTEGHEYERYIAEASGRSQHYQGNPFKMQHQQASFHPMDRQTEFTRNMNGLPVYMGAPLQISTRKESVNASQRVVDCVANRLQRCDSDRYMAGPSGRSQYFQNNPFKMQYQPASFSPMDHQTEFNKNMNELPGHIGALLTISTRNVNANAWHGDVDYIANQAQGCDYERYMPEASARSQHFRDNLSKMQHQEASFGPMDRDRQIEFNKKMNELPVYVGAPLTISIRKETDNAWRRDVDYVSNQAQECDCQRYTAEASGQSQHYRNINASKRVLKL